MVAAFSAPDPPPFGGRKSSPDVRSTGAVRSDHVETLGEIDHEAREEAHRLGIARFEMSAGLNDSPKFIEALSKMVHQALGQPVQRLMRFNSFGGTLAEP